MNLYAYVEGNPINFGDPWGLFSVKGSWAPQPRFNLTGVNWDWRSTNVTKPSWSWWGYLKALKVHGSATGFVNVDVKCVRDDGCEWEVHEKINCSASGSFDAGPNLYALGSGLVFTPAVGVIVNMFALGGSLLDMEYDLLQMAEDKAGPIIRALLDKGPTAICIGTSGAK